MPIPVKMMLPFAVVFALLVGGCGRTLEGRYEAQPPRLAIPAGANPNLQRQFDAAMAQATSLMQSFLEFDGHKVRIGSSAVVVVCSYRVNGSMIEVEVEAMGQKAVIPMTINEDGTINYMGQQYRRVR